jgi:hypothetical protein
MWFVLSRTRRLGGRKGKSQFRMLKRWASQEQKESIADKRSCKRRLVLLLQAVYRCYHLDWITIWLYMDPYVIEWTPELNIKMIQSSSSGKEAAVLMLQPHHLPLFRASREYWIPSVGVALLSRVLFLFPFFAQSASLIYVYNEEIVSKYSKRNPLQCCNGSALSCNANFISALPASCNRHSCSSITHQTLQYFSK